MEASQPPEPPLPTVAEIAKESRRRRRSTPAAKAAPPANRHDLLSLAEVLAELDVPKSTFFRWKATGKAPLTIKYPNGSLRIRRSVLDAWLRDHEEREGAA